VILAEVCVKLAEVLADVCVPWPAAGRATADTPSPQRADLQVSQQFKKWAEYMEGDAGLRGVYNGCRAFLKAKGERWLLLQPGAPHNHGMGKTAALMATVEAAQATASAATHNQNSVLRGVTMAVNDHIEDLCVEASLSDRDSVLILSSQAKFRSDPGRKVKCSQKGMVRSARCAFRPMYCFFLNF
jgi:hypothetical protein